MIGIDRDQTAIALGADLVEQAGGRLTLIEDRFSNLERLRAKPASRRSTASCSISASRRCSSTLPDAASRSASTARSICAWAARAPAPPIWSTRPSERDLADIIFTLGEERHSRAVARAIVKARASAPIETTRALAEIVASVVRSRPGDIHPATRTFQALRIFVNDELGELVSGASAPPSASSKPGGRLVVVSFHSLEDRIVKTFLADRGGSRGGSRHAPRGRTPGADIPHAHQATDDCR